jgi:hypothetical protein
MCARESLYYDYNIPRSSTISNISHMRSTYSTGTPSSGRKERTRKRPASVENICQSYVLKNGMWRKIRRRAGLSPGMANCRQCSSNISRFFSERNHGAQEPGTEPSMSASAMLAISASVRSLFFFLRDRIMANSSSVNLFFANRNSSETRLIFCKYTGAQKLAYFRKQTIRKDTTLYQKILNKDTKRYYIMQKDTTLSHEI